MLRKKLQIIPLVMLGGLLTSAALFTSCNSNKEEKTETPAAQPAVSPEPVKETNPPDTTKKMDNGETKPVVPGTKTEPAP
jgi:flagellar basal body-associated protein FliL